MRGELLNFFYQNSSNKKKHFLFSGVKLIFNNSDSKRREKYKNCNKNNCNPRTVIECCDKSCEHVCKSNCKSHGQPESASLVACCKPGCSKSLEHKIDF